MERNVIYGDFTAVKLYYSYVEIYILTKFNICVHE